VTGASPRTPVQSTGSQNFYLVGNGFSTGLTVTFTLPSGSTRVVSGSQILSVSATVVAFATTFEAAGTWSVVVTTAAGTSAPWTFTVGAGS
jgi:hypothetical protein